VDADSIEEEVAIFPSRAVVTRVQSRVQHGLRHNHTEVTQR
jgi:hypothetical protein